MTLALNPPKFISKASSCALILLLGAVSITANAQTCKTTSIQATTPTDRFKELGNGSEIKDTQTGLIWQRCSVGQTWNSNNKSCDGTATTHNWKQALQVAQQQGSDYRLPNIKELKSIVEQQCYDPAINLSIFPNTPDSFYWSSSPLALDSNSAWGVYFYPGNYNYNYKSSSNYVRAVRSAP